ncbi:penicillin-binding protein activator [Chthonobacter albigriseus]|uniref:penicillin-binding protein activator n=1 Tax=Chthonobacter albigriseus TaxID=1683161 RepID=UPI0015EE90A4|nr:penicillin-binding protein activator [Chthonobacter albigriseus]
MNRVGDDERASEQGRRHFSRRQALFLLGGSAAALAGCAPTGGGMTYQPIAPMQSTLPVPTGETIGTGNVRVGLLLPRTAQGNAAALATAMRNAAELGLRDFVGADITILVKDSGGTGPVAAAAAQQAIAEGAEIILGPVFADEVRQVAPIAGAAGVPVLSFSSDPGVAQPGIYIMGFLVDDQVRQLLAQASTGGLRSMAALISTGAFGTLAEAALRQMAPRYGIRLVQVEQYSGQDLPQKVAAVAANAAQIDGIFIPDDRAAAVVQQLVSAGVDTRRVRVLGSGTWNNPAVYANPALVGAWFPAPEISGFQTFTGRYRAAYGSEPQLTATLAYDAVVLAASLVKQAGTQRFQRSVLADPQGFISGVNGLFRFNADGTNDRGLAIYEATGGAPRLVQPAPRAFTGF